MSDHRFSAVIETGADDPSSELRQLGARAHQLRATTRAADHHIALAAPDAANTASWLMSASLDLSAELVTGIDGLARTPFDEARPDPATIEPHDSQFTRRVAVATATSRAA